MYLPMATIFFVVDIAVIVILWFSFWSLLKYLKEKPIPLWVTVFCIKENSEIIENRFIQWMSHEVYHCYVSWVINVNFQNVLLSLSPSCFGRHVQLFTYSQPYSPKFQICNTNSICLIYIIRFEFSCVVKIQCDSNELWYRIKRLVPILRENMLKSYFLFSHYQFLTSLNNITPLPSMLPTRIYILFELSNST